MKMEFINPIPLVSNARWDARHLGVVEADDSIEEVGDVLSSDGAIDNVGFSWRPVAQKFWNPAGADQLAILLRYDPAYFRIQWTIENGIPGDAILLEVCGPGTHPSDGVSHRTHIEIVGHADIVRATTASLETVWLPGFVGSSYGEICSQMKVRVMGLYNPDGDAVIRLSITLLGGMVVEEARSWETPEHVLTRDPRALPKEVTNPSTQAITDAFEVEDLQTHLRPVVPEGVDPIADQIDAVLDDGEGDA